MTNEFVYEDRKSVTKLNEATHFLPELRNGRDLRTDSHSSQRIRSFIYEWNQYWIKLQEVVDDLEFTLSLWSITTYELLLLLITLLNGFGFGFGYLKILVVFTGFGFGFVLPSLWKSNINFTNCIYKSEIPFFYNVRINCGEPYFFFKFFYFVAILTLSSDLYN